jgi:predicted enzyme related to lactoylglutathione lyase
VSKLAQLVLVELFKEAKAMLFAIFRPSRIVKLSRIGVLLIGIMVFSGCSSVGQYQNVTQQLTAITESPTDTYHIGKFVWMDLLTPDAAAARDFYGALFDWSFEQEGRYTMVKNNGHRIAGILEVEPKPGKQGEPLWIASLSVTDVDFAANYVESQGGEVLKGPVDMQKRGRGALVSDPQGAQLILLRAVGGDPEDSEAGIGDWGWNEIWSNEPLETSRFYQNLGAYESIKLEDDYEILLNDGALHAGIRYITKDKFQTQWVPIVRVAEPEALLDKVEALGGVVWLRPDEPPSNGHTALIADNKGALLMIQRWSSEQTDEAE